MRRLAFTAAVCGTLVLAACSDQTPTEPSAPPPEQSISPSCRPSPHFPIVQVAGLIVKVFPRGKLQLEALARGAAVALFWETCKKEAAQRAAVNFVNFMNANSSRLTGTPAQRNTLISLILNGVGIPFITPPLGTADFGLGIFIPGNTTVIKTLSGTALIVLDPGAFLEQTVIVITRRADDSDPLNFVGNQFPPFWDYDAINASGNHVLQEGHPAIIGFCLLDTDFQSYPESREVGHNPVFGAPGFPFEILEDVDLATERPALYAELVAKCPALQPNTIIIGGFGQGVPGVVNAAWRTARYYLAPAATLLLPEALHAATLAVGTLPPPTKRIQSLSPVGTVSPRTLSVSSGNNQEGFANQILTAPLVVRVSQGEIPIQDADVTFQVTSGGGSITPSATTNASGQAEANWTLGSTVGAQTATASTPGASPLTFTATATAPPPVRAVLQWGSTPSDLDFHLTGPTATAGRFHVYYGSPGSLTSAPFASLDRDDTSAFGPETITISQLAAGGPYRFSVHDFSNLNADSDSPSSALAGSGATVTLYLASGFSQVFPVPPDQDGTLWTVFTFSDGTITSVNTMGYTSDPSDVTVFSLFGRTADAMQSDAAVIRDAAARHPK